MRSHKHKVVRRTRTAMGRNRATLRTTILLLPRFHNPDAEGSRRKIELHKWKLTLREIEQFFPGYQRFRVRGWNKKDKVRDSLYRFEADIVVTRAKANWIRHWKIVLADRFDQCEIYIKMSGRVIWL